MAVFGNPQDILSTTYPLSGQFSPETAMQEQALNRKRLITNLLMQQGLQGAPAGQMVGRFYVPSSPLQGASHLLQAGLGAYLGNRINTEQQGLAKSESDAKDKIIQAYLDARKPKQVTDQPPAPPAPLPPPAQESSGQAMPTEPFRGIAPRPEGPYSGEVGAAAMPDVGVQSAAPPIPAPIRDSIAGQENMRGLDMQNVQPADMSQFASPAGPAPQAPPMPPAAPPMPPSQPTMRTVEQSPDEKYAEIVKLMTNQIPAVRDFGRMEYQRMMQEAEHARDQGNREEDRNVRREGILENSRMREAQLQNNMALTHMQIESRLQQGRDANDLKASLAQQANELQKIQMQNSADLKKAEIGSRSQIAKGQQDTMKAIAQMNMEGRKEIAGMKNDAKQEGKEQSRESAMATIAQLRDSYDQLDKMGGITNTDKSGFDNLKASASSSPVGQFFGKMVGTEAQSHRNTIKQLRVPLVTQVMRATGASAKSLDSNMELKAWLDAASSPDNIDIQANRRALDNLENVINSGKLPGEPGFTYAHKSVGSAPTQGTSSGSLSPAEQQELDALRKKYGR